MVAAGFIQQRRRQFDDEFFAVSGIREVDRIIRVNQQQLTGAERVLLTAAAPEAMALQQNLQVVNGLQRG